MNDKKIKSIIAVLASAALVAGAFLAQKRAAAGKTYPMTADAFLLDTYCSLTVYAGGGGDALTAARDELKRYDALFNAENSDSDIYRINHRTGDTVKIDPDTAGMLSMAKEMQEMSGGALWPGIRPLTELWDIKNRKTKPDAAEVESALSRSEKASWDIRDMGAEGWFFVAENGDTMIEPGAFAKGYIADRLKEVLSERGVSSAIIDLGGNVHTIGVNTDGTPFRIGIRDPGGKESYIELLEAAGDSVVTAGSYERYFMEDGIRYHHILDPKTGYPASGGLASVTVKGQSSFVCDALATACFVLGEEDGRKLIEKFNAENGTKYEGIFIKDVKDP